MRRYSILFTLRESSFDNLYELRNDQGDYRSGQTTIGFCLQHVLRLAVDCARIRHETRWSSAC